MKKNIKLFVNNNENAKQCAELVKRKFNAYGFNVVDNDDFEIAIAIGGDGSFIRMLKNNNYNEDLYYLGINAGSLGFLQEVGINDINNFIEELINDEYKIENVGIQETNVYNGNIVETHYSANEIVLRNAVVNGIVHIGVYIDDNILENFVGDGILVATSLGSTAHNYSAKGAIVYSDLPSLQITHLQPNISCINSCLNNSVIIPSDRIIKLLPQNENICLSVDGVNYLYNNIDSITSTIGKKRIRMLRFNHYNYPQKIREKMLGISYNKNR